MGGTQDRYYDDYDDGCCNCSVIHRIQNPPKKHKHKSVSYNSSDDSDEIRYQRKKMRKRKKLKKKRKKKRHKLRNIKKYKSKTVPTYMDNNDNNSNNNINTNFDWLSHTQNNNINTNNNNDIMNMNEFKIPKIARHNRSTSMPAYIMSMKYTNLTFPETNLQTIPANNNNVNNFNIVVDNESIINDQQQQTTHQTGGLKGMNNININANFLGDLPGIQSGLSPLKSGIEDNSVDLNTPNSKDTNNTRNAPKDTPASNLSSLSF